MALRQSAPRRRNPSGSSGIHRQLHAYNRYQRWCRYVLVRSTFRLASRVQRKRWFGTTDLKSFTATMDRLYERDLRGSQRAQAEFDRLFSKLEAGARPFLTAHHLQGRTRSPAH